MPFSTRFFAPLALMLALGAPARAQVHFTGETRVDVVVIRDALQNILRVAAANEQCSVIDAVQSRTLAPDYRPPAASAVAAAGARYERWDVTLCGRVVPFLLGFWQPPEGGTMFQIGYPFPAEASPEG